MSAKFRALLMSAVAVVLLAPSAHTQTPSSPPEGKAILARVIQGLGGEARIRTVRSVRARSTTRVGPETIKAETLVVFPDTFVQRQTHAQGEVTIVITPKAAFVRTPDGVEDLPINELDDLIVQMSRDPILIVQHAGDPDYEFLAAGPQRVGNVETDVLDVRTPLGDVRWFVDRRNGHIVRASFTSESGMLETTRSTEDYSDRRNVDGVSFFFKEIDQENDLTTTADFESFEVNPTVPPGLFTKSGRAEPAPASNAEGRALIAAVVEALGGSNKVVSLKSLRVRAETRFRQGGPSDILQSQTIVALPDRVRHTLTAGPFEFGFVVSGARAFLLLKGDVTDLPPASRAMTLADMDPSFADVDPLRDPVFVAQHAGDAAFTFTARGSTRVGNVEARILDVSHPKADVRWFIDPGTNRVVRATWKIPRTDIEISKDYTAWTEVDGLWFPFTAAVVISPQGRATTSAFKTVEVNPATNAALFEKRVFPPVERAELKAIAGARAIRVVDAWGGLGTPRTAGYNLRRGASAFAGTSSSGRNPQDASARMTVPMDVAQAFLRTLGAARLEDREYTPRISHTDDYPDIRIEITLDSGIVVFHTKSQGSDHTPWAATIGGKTYVVPSAAPARALELLEPYLTRAPLPVPR